MSITILRNSSGDIPYCHHVEISMGEYESNIKCPPNDPRVKKAKKEGKHVFEVEYSSVHYFDDIGFLHCNICGWTP